MDRRASYGLPMLNGEAVGSLTSCSTNLHHSCDFHMAQKYRQFMQAWREPAPNHCKPKRKRPLTDAAVCVYLDRLGVNMEPHCDKSS